MLLQGQPQAGGLAAFIPLILILAVFYVIVYLPSRKRQKQTQKMLDNLEPGNKVVTSGGIYGTIVGLKGDRIQVKIAENVKVYMSRSAVVGLRNPDEE